MTQNFTGRRFVEADFTGAEFRECDLSGARFVGAVLVDVEIDAYVQHLTINGIDVMPLVEAELDRLHPERLALTPTTPAEALAALDVVESFWAPTLAAAAQAPGAAHTRVDGEWSLIETLRHLVFVHDMWFRERVLGLDDVHPLGLRAGLPADPGEQPELAVVLDLLDSRRGELREHLTTLDDLETPVRDCITTILSEQWTHHRFAVRDLSRLLGADGPG